MALSDNLISYWKLDEASGNATDSHGSNTLTDNNTVGSATGKVGNARSFVNANSESFSISDNASISTGDINFTVQAWVNASAVNSYRVIAGKYDSGLSNSEWELGTLNLGSGIRFTFLANGPSAETVAAFSAITPPSTSTWYHIVVWHDATNNQIGITVNDGTPVTTSKTDGCRDTGTQFRIGARSTDNFYWDGLIDEVGFWKRVLTSAEITELYNSGSGRDYSYITGGGGGGTVIPVFMNQYRQRWG